METLSKSISASLAEEGNAQHRFVSIKTVSPTRPVLCLEKTPFQSRNICPTTDQFLYAFPSLCLVLQVLRKVSSDQTGKTLLVTPKCQSQICSSFLLEMSIVRPLPLPKSLGLRNPQTEVYPLIVNRTRGLVVWTILGKD